MQRGVFVTGTDTGVGKTVVSAVLCRAWGADYWKPVQTGLAEEEGDTATVARLAGLGPERLHRPRYAFDKPLSPHAAAEGETVRVSDFELPASDRPIVVEGAGGALVPLNETELMIDLMVRLGLPVVVVVQDRLGAINHALLTLEALRARSLDVLGLIFVGGPFADNRAIIERQGAVRTLAQLPWSDPVGPEDVAAWANRIQPMGASAEEHPPHQPSGQEGQNTGHD